MRKDRYVKRHFHKKSLTLVLAVALSCVLLVCGVVGGTLAWLTDKTTPVVNTFTYGDINITLSETTGNSYKMVPGNDIIKDPKVTVTAGSEACWLFIKVEAENNPEDYLDYSIDNTYWAELGTNYPGIYYYKGTDLDQLLTEAKTYNIFTDKKVIVKSTVTKEQMTAIGENYPTITFTAYAVQKDNVDSAAEAWAKINFPSGN